MLKKAIHLVADELRDETIPLDDHVPRRAQERIEQLVGAVRSELAGQSRVPREIREEDSELDHPPVFDVALAAVADVRVLGAAADSADAPQRAQHPGQGDAADEAGRIGRGVGRRHALSLARIIHDPSSLTAEDFVNRAS